jgi:hypothetical protein
MTAADRQSHDGTPAPFANYSASSLYLAEPAGLSSRNRRLLRDAPLHI